MNGAFIIRYIINIIMIKIPNISFRVYSGWKLVLSRFILIPRGLFDPVICRAIRCIITIIIITKGIR